MSNSFENDYERCCIAIILTAKAIIMGRKTIDFGLNLDNFIEMAWSKVNIKTEAEYLRHLARRHKEKKETR